MFDIRISKELSKIDCKLGIVIIRRVVQVFCWSGNPSGVDYNLWVPIKDFGEFSKIEDISNYLVTMKFQALPS
jgi:hypothetical protein